jgi:hypothetical protein
MNIRRSLEVCLDELNSGTATSQSLRRTEQIIDIAIAQKQELEDTINSASQALSRAKREVQRDF